MRIRILKFGGTCLGRVEDRVAAAARVREARDGGLVPVVVVSAPGRRGAPYATDTLIELGLSTCGDLPPRETALLLSTGETVAAVLMTATLIDHGVAAQAIVGQAAGIQTANGYVGAEVASVEPVRVVRLLGREIVPVVTGFQGTGPEGDVAVLDRGGSDVTAAALGHALAADAVDIFRDIPGMMTADPRVVPEARLIERLGYREAGLLARHGPKVVHPGALLWARRGRMTVHLRPLSGADAGTTVAGYSHQEGEGPLSIVWRQVDSGAARVAIIHAGRDGNPRQQEVIRTILSTDCIPAHVVQRTAGAVIAVVPLEDAEQAVRTLHAQLFETHETGNIRPVMEAAQ